MDFGRCHMLGSWVEWDNSVHMDESQIVRQNRAKASDFDFIVSRENQEAWFSSTTDIPYYRTCLDDCTCYDFQERKLPCKHIYRLAAELGIIEIINRPTFNKEILAEVKASADIDAHPEQLKRQKSAMDKKCAPTDINYDEKSALFSGSGKQPYATTIDSCTCRDFFVRRLPCKHIYRLRYELSNKG